MFVAGSTDKPELDNDLLMHFGVKGMKWGVRKRRSSGGDGPTRIALKETRKGVQVSGGKNLPAHRDAKVAAVAAQKAKVSGTHSLSNHELRTLLNRLDMEQKYRKAHPPKGAKVFVEKRLKEFGNAELDKISRGDLSRLHQIEAVLNKQGVTGKHRKK